ncbi:hypothetical protein FRC08_007030 [Ceratobasidium sp. 394]|nr:hypothetical protein FRC08_007030 [Ceratobasidium sp. 394]
MVASGVSVPLTNGPALPCTPTSRSKFKGKLSSNLNEFARRIKPKFPGFAVFATTMTGPLVVRDAVK